MDAENTLLSFIQSQIDAMEDSIRKAQPLHMRDKRMTPSDGQGNYVTIIEQQILDAMTFEQNRMLKFWKDKKEELLDIIAQRSKH